MEDLQRQRDAIRRGLLRANTAAVAILLVVIGLALAAIWQARRTELERQRADQERARALAAEQDARDKLWRSSLAQARAGRASGRAGQRFVSLESIRLAAAI